MCNWGVITVSFLLFFCFSSDKNTLLKLEIFYVIYFPGTHLTQTATILIYNYLHVILSLRMG